MTLKSTNFVPFFEPKRDAYGFAVRPQHLQRYKEYTTIYKEEEEERSDKWKTFLDQQTESTEPCSPEKRKSKLHAEVTVQKTKPGPKPSGEGDRVSRRKSSFDSQTERDIEEVNVETQTKTDKLQTWAQIRSSLHAIEKMMSFRVRMRKNSKMEQMASAESNPSSIEGAKTSSLESEGVLEEEFCDNEILYGTTNGPAEESAASGDVSQEPFFPWKQELESLVHGGVPRDLRGEVWQAFIGVRTRRVERYYQNLLARENDDANDAQWRDKAANDSKGTNTNKVGAPEKWRRQIEKDLHRTFPGHPALDENGRSSLRRILLAYAWHNPSVGYCQAMNFFAGLLLLMMPEESAFWALVGIIDDYFDGYYSEEMIESQVDQLVFEELMRQRLPKLVNHLDYLGVQVAWISGPWFLSIFVNMLPWESVLRIWDVLLYEGNRVMLFRTALALMELYGPALVTTKDAGDAITLLQSLAGSTFDSSQLVLTACMGFLAVTEDRLEELRVKYRPSILKAIEERSRGQVSEDSKGIAAKLYSFKHDRKTPKKANAEVESGGKLIDRKNTPLETQSANMDDFLSGLDIELDSLPDIQDQVVWLKVEFCRLLEEKRSAVLRAEELETALMEMVKQDNRRQLSARVELLEQEITELQEALASKKEQENAMLQVLLRVEQEQKVTEDARIFAEQDAAAQKYAVKMLQEKYERAVASLAQMEKRAVMAETMLEATVQYEHGQVKALASPRPGRPDYSRELPARKIGLLPFGIGWRDRNKGKPPGAEEPSQSKPAGEELAPGIAINSSGSHEQEK